MSSLSLAQKTALERLFNMSGGYVLGFSNASFTNLFGELNIDIYDEKYSDLGNSKANRMRSFWKNSSDDEALLLLNSLADFMEASGSSVDPWSDEASHETSEKQVAEIRAIAQQLGASNTTERSAATNTQDNTTTTTTTSATVENNKIQIEIHEDIYNHIRQYLDTGDYFHAVDESYKVVREKLRGITGEEKATEVFNMNAENKRHYPNLFGKSEGETDAEKDFLRGVGYLNLTIQFLRNEKSHSLATPIDPNLAIHYISLASLAYDLISRHVSNKTIEEIEAAILAQKQKYKSASSFYEDFEDGKWMQVNDLPAKLSTSIRQALKTKWLDEIDLTVSYSHSNIAFMRLELIANELTRQDIDVILELPTEDAHGHDQSAGKLMFFQYIQKEYPTKLSPKARTWIKQQEAK